MKKAIDFTKGDSFKLLLMFTLPSLAGNLLNQVYSITDSIIVGRVLGETALAAVGVCMPIILLVATLIIGVNIGVCIVISQFYGNNDEESIRKAIVNSLMLGFIVSLIPVLIGIPFTRPILLLMQTPAGPLEEACTYMRINFITTIFPMMYFLFNNIFRGIGDSLTALYCLIVSVIFNIILDFVFVAILGWGVGGSAWATAISQALSVIFAITMLFRKYPNLKLKKSDIKFNKALFLRISNLAIPVAIQNSFNNFGNIIVQSCINGFGQSIMAAYTCASRIGTLGLMPLEGVGSSYSVYVGQNVGCKNYERVKTGMISAFKIDVLFYVIVSSIMVFFGKPLIHLFLENPSNDVLNPAYSYIVIVGVTSITSGIMLLFHEVFKGWGRPKISMIGGFMQLGTKVLMAILGAKLLNLNIVWFAWPASFIVGTIYPYICYRKLWKE